MSVDRRRSNSETDSDSNNKVIGWIVSSGAVLSLSGLVILAVGVLLLLAVPDLETAGKVLKDLKLSPLTDAEVSSKEERTEPGD